MLRPGLPPHGSCCSLLFWGNRQLPSPNWSRAPHEGLWGGTCRRKETGAGRRKRVQAARWADSGSGQEPLTTVVCRRSVCCMAGAVPRWPLDVPAFPSGILFAPFMLPWGVGTCAGSRKRRGGFAKEPSLWMPRRGKGKEPSGEHVRGTCYGHLTRTSHWALFLFSVLHNGAGQWKEGVTTSPAPPHSSSTPHGIRRGRASPAASGTHTWHPQAHPH